MNAIKFRGKVGNNWWVTTPDDGSWEQFWSLADRKTIGLFTGSSDINLKSVFEGDIVYWKNSNNPNNPDNRGVVEYDSSLAMFLVDGYALHEILDDSKGVVVGNIYETGEM